MVNGKIKNNLKNHELGFVVFTGEENEIEFLKACVKQWTLTVNQSIPEVIKVMQLGTVFSEIQHRIADLTIRDLKSNKN